MNHSLRGYEPKHNPKFQTHTQQYSNKKTHEIAIPEPETGILLAISLVILYVFKGRKR